MTKPTTQANALTPAELGTTRQAIAAKDRSRPRQVTGRLKRALDAMVWQRLDRAQAAAQAGMTDHSLREALRKPHVVAYYRGQVKVLRTSALARNVHALEETRDQTDNWQARVAAIKALEQMDAEDDATSSRPKAPGVVIVVQGGAQVTGAYPTHGAKPLISHDDGPNE